MKNKNYKSNWHKQVNTILEEVFKTEIPEILRQKIYKIIRLITQREVSGWNAGLYYIARLIKEKYEK